MTGLLSQFMVKDEVTFGTGVVVDRAFETNTPALIVPVQGRTTANAMRSGTRAPRSTMFAAYSMGGTGSVEMDVPTKGFGWWLKHMLGAVATAGPTDSNYTHTGTIASLTGDSFTAQTGLPFNSATVQPLTGEGGKILSWELGCDVEGVLVFKAEFDFEEVKTGTALASTSGAYPSGALVFNWISGSITFDAGAVELKSFKVAQTNPLKTDRRFLRGSALKKEQLEEGVRDIQWTAEAEWADLTSYNKWVATTPSGTQVAIVATFDGPIAHGGATLPRVVITIPVGRIDNAAPAPAGVGIVGQTISGIAMDDATNSPISVSFRSTDATP